LRPTDDVVFTGRLPDVRPTVADSRVAIVPLRLGGGTRVKVLQAMALGTPVVSTSKGVEGLDLEPDVDVLVADEPEAFAARVVSLLEDDALQTRLSARGRSVAEARTWQRSAAILERVIERAVAERGRG
jgi:glycosyltransferase involved in cell wall biosynthesis